MVQLLRQAMEGLAFLHSQERLHQSVGPSSLVLNLTDERFACMRFAIVPSKPVIRSNFNKQGCLV